MTTRIKNLKQYKRQYKASVENPEKFWATEAATFDWFKKWDKVLDWEFKTPNVKWFVNGKTNITINAIDRHLQHHGDQTALLWEPNNPDAPARRFSYQELHDAVARFANGLRALGVKKGDRICLYMPMIPELAIGILATARIGAIHSVVFAGFSAQALANRINDATCKIVITADHNHRGRKNIPVKSVVDEALQIGCPSIEKVIIKKNTSAPIAWNKQKDIWWADVIKNRRRHCKPAVMDSEDPLFILYTSGSTGKPKGVVHTCGGYMVYAEYSFKNVFQYDRGDVYWCTADIGWITGHTYIVYGPLLAGATTLMFEGVPTYPSPDRFWRICEKHHVNQFYTAPTAIRALMAKGDEYVAHVDLSKLKVIGSVGEPINIEAWNWYDKKIGKGNVPIVDTWWQTETGGIMITPLPGITDTKPCFASYPLPGIQPILLDKEGKELIGNNVEGLLAIKFPWPAMLRTLYGDHERCKNVYFTSFAGKYFTGDGAKRDAQGRYRIMGRVDDVINVSGHRMGTAEVEDAIDEHPNIVESAVVGFPHPIKGEGIYAYVVVKDDSINEEKEIKEILKIVRKVIGPIAKPDVIQFVTGLPKTRSGKIMRRILRKIAAGEKSNFGDISTLLNPEIVAAILREVK